MNYEINPMGRLMRKAVIITIGTCLVLAPISAASGGPKGRPSTYGQLISYGEVTINNRPAPTGASVFSNSLINVPCAPGSSAIIRIGADSVLELKSGAQLRLKFAKGEIGGELLEGSLRVRTRQGVRLNLTTPDGVIVTDGQASALTPVSASKAGSCQFDQLASIDNTGTAPTPQGQSRRAGQSGQAGRAASPTYALGSDISPFALAALVFSISFSGAIAIVAITESRNQISPIFP